MSKKKPTKRQRSEKRYAQKANRFANEIREIESMMYDIPDGDAMLRCFMAERKRDDIVRSVVIQLHTSIEDVLNNWVKCRLMGCTRTKLPRVARSRRVASRFLDDVLSGGRSMGFDTKLRLMVGLRMIDRRLYNRLVELNVIRNKCSHHWLLNVPVRRGIKPQNKKRPLLQFRGENLHKLEVRNKFLREFGPLHPKLFLKTL